MDGHADRSNNGGSATGVKPEPAATPPRGSSDAAHVWEEASRAEMVQLARAYETDWRNAPVRKPDVRSYLKGDLRENAGARLALLRADLAIRWETGDRVRVEWYMQRFPDLTDETLVALLYEEFCLREEADDSPDVSEYHARFPSVSEALQRVFDIHGIVGSGTTTATHPSGRLEFGSPFPEAGQTIGGFRLVEELGRGSFARVFRAEERQLADRAVAVKLARRGSREPQTLARLQHTNIVPVHSYRVDSVTGLHLMCMPYFGRVTLARLLEKPEMRIARNGAEILAIIDSLERDNATTEQTAAARVRRHFASLPYDRAIAWWGARLADALQHAHERGFLHRDIKPSNVLITPDGLPMLLDFNLAQPTGAGGDVEANEPPGGTFSYMAPEHLEALAQGNAAAVDARADIFSLGVVLYEAMGSRPFPNRPTLISGDWADTLRRAAWERRHEIPSLLDQHPDTSPAFEAVVRRCLAPSPANRYASAAELATDLHAVADDAPLHYAREPQPARTIRWLRRNRLRLIVAIPLMVLAAVTFVWWVNSRFQLAKTRSEVQDWITDGRQALTEGRHAEALRCFAAAEQLARDNLELADLRAAARDRVHEAKEGQAIRENVRRLFRDSGRLRFALLGFGSSERPAALEIRERLRPFQVFTLRDWTTLPELALLDASLVARVVQEVEELLFFWTVATVADAQSTAPLLRDAETVCDTAIRFSQSKRPWEALRERCRARLAGRTPETSVEPDTSEIQSAWTCFQWGLIHGHVDSNRPRRSLEWLDRSVRLDPGHYWPQYFLGYYYDREGQYDKALAHYNAAIALDPGSPWALLSKARLAWPRGEWDLARADLDLAIRLAAEIKQPFPEAVHERGLVYQRLGDFRDSLRDYQVVIQQLGLAHPLGRSALLNRALIAIEQGRLRAAEDIYDSLLSSASKQEERASILLGEFRLNTRRGVLTQADANMASLLRDHPADPEYLTQRARLRLAQDRPLEALDDAELAAKLDASPIRERLRIRAMLAAGRYASLRLDDPGDVRALPGNRTKLWTDIRRAIHYFEQHEASDTQALINEAVLRSALGDRKVLILSEEVTRAEPRSVRAFLTRARIRLWMGDRAGAGEDIEQGLELDPENAHLFELRAMLELHANETSAALVDLDRSARLGLTSSIYATRARAFTAAGNARAAFMEWTRQLALDLDQPDSYLQRAQVALQLGLVDLAFADLEVAISLADDRPDLFPMITLVYSRCVIARPARLERLALLLGRALSKADDWAVPHWLARFEPGTDPLHGRRAFAKSQP